MNFTIRKMKMEDIHQVQQVAKTSWNSTYEGIIPLKIQENFLKSAYNDEMMQKRLEGSFIFVSEVDRKIVGFSNFSPVKEGAKEIFINVEKENRIGTTFYKAKGFEVVSEFDDNFDGHILKTVRMVLKL